MQTISSPRVYCVFLYNMFPSFPTHFKVTSFLFCFLSCLFSSQRKHLPSCALMVYIVRFSLSASWRVPWRHIPWFFKHFAQMIPMIRKGLLCELGHWIPSTLSIARLMLAALFWRPSEDASSQQGEGHALWRGALCCQAPGVLVSWGYSEAWSGGGKSDWGLDSVRSLGWRRSLPSSLSPLVLMAAFISAWHSPWVLSPNFPCIRTPVVLD